MEIAFRLFIVGGIFCFTWIEKLQGEHPAGPKLDARNEATPGWIFSPAPGSDHAF